MDSSTEQHVVGHLRAVTEQLAELLSRSDLPEDSGARRALREARYFMQSHGLGNYYPEKGE